MNMRKNNKTMEGDLQKNCVDLGRRVSRVQLTYNQQRVTEEPTVSAF
jgi:hypothetical protein